MKVGAMARETPTRPDREVGLLAAASLVVMFGPTFYDLFTGLWQSDGQAHGPIVFAVSAWLLYRQWDVFVIAPPARTRPLVAWPLLGVGLLSYVMGRSQSVASAEVGAFIIVLIALVLLLKGSAALKTIWFPLFFMCFMVPLPGPFVDAVTMPMKLAVSYVAEHLLFAAGYPIARNGVILQIAQYQLLVADACAGLHTLFSLEALGLLYLNLVRHASILRNVLLAVCIVPISFTANVIRVMILTLITYYFGDSAGQGFLHGFAGMVLFLSALLLIIAVDSVLRLYAGTRASLIGEVGR